MKKRTKSSIGKTLVAFLVVGALALGVNHFLSIWQVGYVEEYIEPNALLTYGLGYIFDPSSTELGYVQEGGYGYFIISSSTYPQASDTVTQLSSFYVDTYLWPKDLTFVDSVIMNDGSVPSGQLSTLENLVAFDTTHGRRVFESTHNIPSYQITAPAVAGDYTVVVWRCDSAHYQCGVGLPLFSGCLHKITKCDATTYSIKVRSFDWCDTGVSGRGNDYCYELFKADAGGKGYCDMEGGHNRCKNVCTCGSGEFCLASYASSGSEVVEVVEKSKYFSEPVCASIGEGVCNVVPGYGECSMGITYKTQGRVQSAIDETDTKETLGHVMPYHCELQDPDSEFIKWINDRFGKNTGKIGQCVPGAQDPNDCYAAFGPAGQFSTVTISGDAMSANAWGVKDGICYLSECDNPVDCTFAYADQAVRCVRAVDTQKYKDYIGMRVCERKSCTQHIDCVNLGAFMEAGLGSYGLEPIVYACVNGMCQKARSSDYPSLQSVAPSYCALDNYAVNPPEVWRIKQTSRGYECVVESLYIDECSPGMSTSELESVCSGISYCNPYEYDYFCVERPVGGNVCGCKLKSGIKINCRNQNTYNDNDEWCMRNCDIPYCMKYLCTGTKTGQGCINCELIDAKCTKKSDCTVGTYEGVCNNGCCDYSGIPPTTTSTTVPNGDDILPSGLNIYSLIGIIICISGFGLLMKVMRNR